MAIALKSGKHTSARVASRLASQAITTRLPIIVPVQPVGAISAGRPE